MPQPHFLTGRIVAAPPAIDAKIARLAGRQHALVTVAQLLSAGLSRSAIAKRVRRGALHRVQRGVYAMVPAHALSREARWLAAVFAAGAGTVLSRRSAAEIHAVNRAPAPLIELISPRRRTVPGAVVQTTRGLDPRDVTIERGVPVTTIHRTLVDLSDVMPAIELVAVIHETAFRGRFVEAAVRDAMARANGRHRLAVLEEAIALHHAGSAGTRSRAERALAHRLRSGGALVNTHVLGFEVDFHWPAHKLVVEIDGGGHGRSAARADDEREDRTLRSAGYTVLRFSDEDARDRPEEVIAAIDVHIRA